MRAQSLRVPSLYNNKSLVKCYSHSPMCWKEKEGVRWRPGVFWVFWRWKDCETISRKFKKASDNMAFECLKEEANVWFLQLLRSIKECKVPTAMSPQDTGAAGMGKREEFRDEGGAQTRGQDVRFSSLVYINPGPCTYWPNMWQNWAFLQTALFSAKFFFGFLMVN